MFVVAFSYLYISTFPASFLVFLLPLKGGIGMDWFAYLTNVSIVAPIKTTDLVPPLTKV